MTAPSSSASEAVADRIAEREPSWLPIAGHVVNITVSLDERDMIVSALRTSSEIERLRAENERLAREAAWATNARQAAHEWTVRAQAAEARAASAEREKAAALGLVEGQIAVIKGLEAKLAVMDAALEEFDDALGEDDDGYPCDTPVTVKWRAHTVMMKLSDLRRAREARASEEEKG